MRNAIRASTKVRELLLKNYKTKQEEINQRRNFINHVESNLIEYKNYIKKRLPNATTEQIKQALNEAHLDDLMQISATIEYIKLLEEQNKIILVNIKTIYDSINSQEFTLSTSKLAYDLSSMLGNIAKIPTDNTKVNDDIEKNLDKTADLLDDLDENANQSLLDTRTAMNAVKKQEIVINDSVYDNILYEKPTLPVEPIPALNRSAKSMMMV